MTSYKIPRSPMILSFGIIFLISVGTNSDIVSREDRSTAANKLMILYSNANNASLLRLSKHSDKMVSYMAQWELNKGDKKRSLEFVTHIEKDVNVKIPAWWTKCLGEIVFRKGGHPHVPFRDANILRSKSKDGLIADISFTNGIHIARTNNVSVNSACYYDIALISKRDPHNEMWKKRVWGTGYVPFSIGVHQMEIVITKNRVFVFGADTSGMYFEVFRLSDGRPELRFCTCYWQWLRMK